MTAPMLFVLATVVVFVFAVIAKTGFFHSSVEADVIRGIVPFIQGFGTIVVKTAIALLVTRATWFPARRFIPAAVAPKAIAKGAMSFTAAEDDFVVDESALIVALLKEAFAVHYASGMCRSRFPIQNI